MDGDRTHPELGQAGPEGRQLRGRLGSPTPGGRVVAEDLEGVEPDLVAAVDGVDHPLAERQVGADPSAVGNHCGIVRAPPSAVSRQPGADGPRTGLRSVLGSARWSACRSRSKVVRAFIKDDRLVSIPARDKKRQVVLRYLVERCFPEDRAYPEREVNQRLARLPPGRRRAPSLPGRRRAA